MFLLDALLAFAPLLMIFYLIIMRRMSADLAGVISWVFCVALACLYFDTALSTALAASLSGVIASLPIAFALSNGMLLVIVMVHTGAMSRIAVLMKTIAPQDRSAQLLVLCCGVGITLSTLGAGPLAILPAIFVALGYPPSLAILLPCAGYTGSCIYALLGTP
ncbi:L-lactate permease, partial [Desulfovibrio sp. OttesenSCG-928-I05]|nr:L-lactate permease [Desulfovibrio sp. OttesenSCG-928-I05]